MTLRQYKGVLRTDIWFQTRITFTVVFPWYILFWNICINTRTLSYLYVNNYFLCRFFKMFVAIMKAKQFCQSNSACVNTYIPPKIYIKGIQQYLQLWCILQMWPYGNIKVCWQYLLIEEILNDESSNYILSQNRLLKTKLIFSWR
jgi:hypothetical protein